jgi:exodeoxyribonuclease-3
VRLATWNVNSLKMRLPRVEEWLAYASPDVVCLQETKVADVAFPSMVFASLGYESAHHGEGRWNGVAILSRVGLDDVRAGLGQPAGTESGVSAEARLIAATCGGVRVHSVYVPNGRSLDHEMYAAKLEWLKQLRDVVAESIAPAGAPPLAVCGDFNIAPDDRDVYDPAKYVSVRSRRWAWSTPSDSCTRKTACSRGGTTGPATSTIIAACASTSCWSAVALRPRCGGR